MNLDEIKDRIEEINKNLRDTNFIKRVKGKLKSEKRHLEDIKDRCKKRYKIFYKDREEVKKYWNYILDSLEQLEDKDLNFEIWKTNFEDIKFYAENVLKIYERSRIEKSEEDLDVKQVKPVKQEIKIKRKKLKKGIEMKKVKRGNE